MSGADPESFVRGASQNLDFCFALDIIFSKERECHAISLPFHWWVDDGAQLYRDLPWGGGSGPAAPSRSAHA